MKSSPQHAVTRVEIAAAIAILAVLLGVVYAGYGLGVRSWEHGQRIHTAVTELRLAGSFIRERIEQSYPLLGTAGGAPRLQFDGEPQRLTLVTWLPEYLGEGGLYEVTFAVDERESGFDLSMSRRRLTFEAPGEEDAERQRRLLVRELSSVEFEYFGSAVDGVPPTWHPRWHARQHLPKLVRLMLTSRHVGKWPAVVMPVNSEPPTRPQAMALPVPGAAPRPLAARGLESQMAALDDP